MHSRSHKRSLVLVASLILLATVACSDSDLHKAASASAKIATGIKEVNKVVQDLYPEFLDKQEVAGVEMWVINGTKANDKFVSRVRSLKQLDPSSKAQVLLWFNELSRGLTDDQAMAVFKVKNPHAQEQLQVAEAAVSAGLVAIAGLLEGGN